MSDSTAAIGIVSRAGRGRTRHTRVRCLWLQQEQDRCDLSITKIGTRDNIADFMTNALKREDVSSILSRMGIVIKNDRAESALAIRAVLQDSENRDTKGGDY